MRQILKPSRCPQIMRPCLSEWANESMLGIATYWYMHVTWSAHARAETCVPNARAHWANGCSRVHKIPYTVSRRDSKCIVIGRREAWYSKSLCGAFLKGLASLEVAVSLFFFALRKPSPKYGNYTCWLTMFGEWCNDISAHTMPADLMRPDLTRIDGKSVSDGTPAKPACGRCDCSWASVS